MLAKSSITAIQAIFTDEKQAKQTLAAAKRVSKKRAAGDDASTTSSPAKRTRKDPFSSTEESPAAVEESLALPASNASEEELSLTVINTNRAPLVLAFAVTLLKYTMPDQPLSSRLSLAQAVVSMNSKSKAVSLGIEKGSSAESEGWGQGQPGVRIMGREIRVMKRWGYDWKAGEDRAKTENVTEEEEANTQDTVKHEEDAKDEEPALWGLDLEALRSSNGPVVPGQGPHNGAGLPIYAAASARAYLLKSFASAPTPRNEAETPPKKKPSAASLNKEKEQNVAKLLQALDLLYTSWAHVLPRDDLDKRAWSWYVAARPDVQNGVAGWGGRGEVSLNQILEMRRKG